MAASLAQARQGIALVRRLYKYRLTDNVEGRRCGAQGRKSRDVSILFTIKVFKIN